ncbi:ATP-dependent DNA helicase RecG [Neomegalonema perideroedes]|uniref:ATP-dependent DNA helicase RecG n=1 Tax=Neomegalonema perideroedes TaxID=217219 RepID=UPI0003601240|nr:ATP-dependent DNA helicase RecG [Neomegalonema perideroedes]
MRPEILYPLFAEPQSLEGVGPKTAAGLEKLGARSVGDMLGILPTGGVDRRLAPDAGASLPGAVMTLELKILRHRNPVRQNMPWRVETEDMAGTPVSLVFFHPNPQHIQKQLPVAATRIISGKREDFDGTIQIIHPEHMLPPEEAEKLPAFEPTYPTAGGLAPRTIANAVAKALAQAPDLPEWLDGPLKARENWPGWLEAVTSLHQPKSRADLDPLSPARRRLAYDEMLSHQLALALMRAQMRQKRRGYSNPGDGSLRAKVWAALPFGPTGAQTRAIAEIEADMASENRMLRLLQGDVGAGKTLVALMAMLIAVESGGQAALMAPTEILARQHAERLAPLAAKAGLRLEVLTGRDKGKARAKLLEELAAGEIHLLVGTHALFQGEVGFKDLRLAVVDEQHRFGVNQRMELAAKGHGVDILTMTATPIPRSLALMSHGDMDFSVLDEKPPGRKPIVTRLISMARYDEVTDGLGRALASGRRAYWICPLVEESAASDLPAAEARHRALAGLFGAERVGLVHGRMSGAEKDEAMSRFQRGETQILVATTVVEVGVDVPEASVMVIEQAERFGLAQLHQLRGRVGRGAESSACLLLHAPGALGETARKRLETMRESEDGFLIAETDLKLRGAGDLLGVKQAGLPAFRYADSEAHDELLAIARDDARLIMTRTPDLASERGRALRILLHLMRRDEAVKYLSSA